MTVCNPDRHSGSLRHSQDEPAVMVNVTMNNLVRLISRQDPTHAGCIQPGAVGIQAVKDPGAQIANFLICGVLALCFAFGLRQVFRSGKGATWGPLLLGIFGLSLIIAGLFVTDPSLGYYPPGTSGSTHTLHGTIHGINAPLAFGSLTIAIFVLARRFASDPAWRGWALYSLLTGSILVGSFIASLAVAVLDEKGILPNSPAGLLERVAIIIGWVWIALLAIRLLRQMRPSVSSTSSTGEQT